MKFALSLALLSTASNAAIILHPRFLDMLTRLGSPLGNTINNDIDSGDDNGMMLEPHFGEMEMMPSSDPFSDFLSSLLTPPVPAAFPSLGLGNSNHHLPDIVRDTLSKTHIKENETMVDITIELPGWTQTEVQVSVHASALTVTGDHKCSADEGQGWCEPRQFTQVFGLKDGKVHLDRSKAELADGLLKISVPKVLDQETEKADERRVLQVSTGNTEIHEGNGKLTIQMV